MAMSFMKSLSIKGSPSSDGYQNKIVEPDTVSDTEDEDMQSALDSKMTTRSEEGDADISFNAFECKKSTASYKPVFGGSFSRLAPSMWPQDLLAALCQPEDSQPPYHYDEYGFIIEVKDGKAILDQNTEEDDQEEGLEPMHEDYKIIMNKQTEEELRAKWIAYLEFNYNEAAKPKMKWSQVELQIRHTRILDELVKFGLPHSMRPNLWLRFSKGLTLKTNSKYTYSEMLDKSNYVQVSDKQILRVLPSNACFMNSSSIGIERLRRILRVVKWLQRSGSNPLSSSHESFNVAIVAAHLLLLCDEEEAFWLTLSCVNELRSFNHQSILKDLIKEHCDIVDKTLKKDEIDISLITSHWFSSLYSGFIIKSHLLFLLWDLYFYYGSIVLFQLSIGLLLQKNDLVTTCQDTAAIFNSISDLPSNITTANKLLTFWNHGAKFVQYFKTGALLSISDGMGRANSMFSLPSFTTEPFPENDIRTKNVRQTSILLELHESIVAIGRHFENHEPKLKAYLIPDYNTSDKFDEDDEINELKRPRQRFRRAKALIDFQRHDPDELGFRRNDIITIISERDEHCWIGELNGLRGWFPAKFVELLDEKNGEYSIAGDDRVIPFINDLIRGRLCNTLKAILNYGLKKTIFVSVHPWNIIEAISSACIESDFNSVYSRLVLTRTFRLDEFARVLTPSEMLYKSVAHLNQIQEHEAMDVKVRSLICIALNQQILHDWFTVIAATQPHILAKYYHNWSYLNSPAWKLIKAELKLLTQFSFNLNPNAEMPEGSQLKSPVSKDGVRDMLVKHHLFSWDI